MKNAKKHIVPVSSLLIYEICYFIFAPYPKNLFDVRLMNPAYQYIPDFITKFCLQAIFIGVVIFICKVVFFNEGYFFISEFFKHLFLCLTFMLPVRLIFDIIINFMPLLKYTYAVQFVADVLFNAVLFILIFKKKGFHCQKTKFSKKTVCLICAACMTAVLFFIILVVETEKSIEYINYINKKYPDILQQNYDMNFSFEMSLYILIFNIISIIMIYFAFYSMVDEVKSVNVNNGRIIARCMSIVLIFFSLYVIKAFLLPKGLLDIFNIEESSTVHYKNTEEFDKNTRTLNIYRLNSHDKSTLVYEKTTTCITYGNKTIAKAYSDNFQSDEKITDHGGGIFSYGTSAIMYTENNKPVCILSQDISGQKKNQRLTQVLEKLIDSEYFDFLEYSYSYMLKYDKDYLKPFLKTYSHGIFNKEKNKNIESSYIVEFSKDALKNDFKE